MLLPCKETYERMVGSHTGIWPELVNDGSIEFAIKLTTDLMKAVLKGAPVTLVTTSIHTSGKTFRVVGFTLEVERNNKVDAAHILKAFLKALKDKRFTGRCEYFQDTGLIEGEKFCWVALGLQWSGGTDTYPSYDWWLSFAEQVRPDLEANSCLNLSSLSEMVTLGEIRESHTLALIIEFVDGKTVGFLDPDEPTADE
jgi:hypothetical protein